MSWFSRSKQACRSPCSGVTKGQSELASTLQAPKSLKLPTNAVLPVVAAAYELIPDDGDFLAKAEKLLRRYIWSAFFTDRYENTAASRAFADFKGIKELLGNPDFTDEQLQSVPVLNRREHPLADVDSLMVAGWPKVQELRRVQYWPSRRILVQSILLTTDRRHTRTLKKGNTITFFLMRCSLRSILIVIER